MLHTKARLPLYSFLFIVTIFVTACVKDRTPASPPVSDARAIKLKEVKTDGSTTSTHYKYTYDAANFVTRIEVGLGFLIYNVVYENNRVKRLVNDIIVDKDTLVYYYEGSRVSKIEQMDDETGRKLAEVKLVYDNTSRLREINWIAINGTLPATVTRKVVFEYYNDNNLLQYQDFRNLGNGLEWVLTYQVLKYDNKRNVENNHFLREPFDHFLFLPQIQLEINNPLEDRIVMKQVQFHSTYTYTYLNDLPIRADKETEVITPDNPATFTVSKQYSY